LDFFATFKLPIFREICQHGTTPKPRIS
jgi:hypothetical protein